MKMLSDLVLQQATATSANSSSDAMNDTRRSYSRSTSEASGQSTLSPSLSHTAGTTGGETDAIISHHLESFRACAKGLRELESITLESVVRQHRKSPPLHATPLQELMTASTSHSSAFSLITSPQSRATAPPSHGTSPCIPDLPLGAEAGSPGGVQGRKRAATTSVSASVLLEKMRGLLPEEDAAAQVLNETLSSVGSSAFFHPIDAASPQRRHSMRH